MLIRILCIFIMAVWLSACSSWSANDAQQQSILHKLNTDKVYVQGKNKLMRAAEQGNSAMLKEAIVEGESINSYNDEASAFALALKNGHVVIANILLAAGVDWESGFEKIESSALIEAARHGFNEIIKALFLREADINYQNANGYSALAVAAINGHLSTVKLLLNAGADVDVYPDGKSILMYLVEQNNMLIAQQLIGAGANLNYRDEEGNSALSIARKNNLVDMEMMLLQAGARP